MLSRRGSSLALWAVCAGAVASCQTDTSPRLTADPVDELDAGAPGSTGPGEVDDDGISPDESDDTDVPDDDAAQDEDFAADDDRGDSEDDDPLDMLVDPLPLPGAPDPSIPGDDDIDSGAPSSPADAVEPVSPVPLTLPQRYLRGEQDTRLVVEIDSVPGMEPRGASEDDFAERFGALLDKPDGIAMKHDDDLESRGEDHLWTDAELQPLSREVFDDDEPDGTVSVHVMFLDGSYQAEDGGVVLAVAWGNRSIAMFTQVIDDSCAGLPSLIGGLDQDACQAAEFGIWSHEMGHVLGLVNNGIEMQRGHEDPEHPHHDVSDGCLMYWAYDGASFVDATFERLGGGQSDIDFCEDSLNDLAAVVESSP